MDENSPGLETYEGVKSILSVRFVLLVFFLSNGKAIQSCILTMFQSHNRPTCLTVGRSQPAAFVFQIWRRNWADCSFAVAAWIAEHLSVTLLFFPPLPHSSSSPSQTMCDQWSILRCILLPNSVVLNVNSSATQKQLSIIRILTDHIGLRVLTFLINLCWGNN